MKSSAVYSGFAAVAFDGGPPLVAVRLADGFDLGPHQIPPAVFILEQRADLPRPRPLLFELFADDEDLETRQAVDLQLEDGVGLLGVELEPRHDLFGRVRLAVRLADDPDDLVERVEDRFEAIEQVDPLLERAELVLEPPGDDLQPEMQEVPENLLEVEPLGPADFRVVRSESGTSG